ELGIGTAIHEVNRLLTSRSTGRQKRGAFGSLRFAPAPVSSALAVPKMRQVAIFLSFMFAGLVVADTTERVMNNYQQEIMDRRTAEARALWQTMESEGFTEDTVAALDFVFFSDSRADATGLKDQLAENYSVELVPAEEQGYVLIKGTTRPYGNEFSYEQWMGWVEFMVGVGFSHNSVFSTWSVYSPKSKTTWSSEEY
ncbi:hypothetical protein QQM79_20680, partial [Marinobacteraceae bacterium S3BR75-40.1]